MDSPAATIVNHIGGGTFGDVFLLKSGLAAKRYKAQHVAGEGLPDDAIKEIALLAGMGGQHVVVSHGVVFEKNVLWCLMEYAPFGDLHSFFQSSSQLFAQAAPIAHQIFSSLAYLHSRNVVHRDIKPENFLIFEMKPKIVIKLADLGCALVHGNGNVHGETSGRSSPITTLWYRAPEIAIGISNMHGPPMDVWAAGVLIFEIYNEGRALFQSANTNFQLLCSMCAFFGTPAVSNDIMPSYNSAVMCGEKLHCLPAPKATTFFPGNLVWRPEWAEQIFRSTLQMEPTRRLSAACCAKLANPFFLPECPKTPRVTYCDDTKKPEEYVCALRALAGGLLFESCLDKGLDRRTFHVAARILDRSCRDCSPLTELRMPALCAGCAIIASKMCTGRDHSKIWEWEHLLDRQIKGVQRFRLSGGVVEAEEIRILKDLAWEIWEVLVIDMPTPTDTDPNVFDYVCDMLVAHMGTKECIPSDLSEIARIIATTIVDPRPTKIFPSVLSATLDRAIQVMNSQIAEKSPIRAKYEQLCGQKILKKVCLNLAAIKFV